MQSGRSTAMRRCGVAASVASLICALAGNGAATATALSVPHGQPVTSVDQCPGASTPSYDAGDDPYSLYNQVRDMGVGAYYAAGAYGKGVDVALIDSGVAPVPGLDHANVIDGPDLSFESQAAYGAHPNLDLPHNDTFGHGTHMAGIIAASDATRDGALDVNDPNQFNGVAPQARVVNVKVADSQGAVDVSQVIAAIDWVVQHRHDDGMNIRVLNLSYGIRSRDAAIIDALTFVVEQAWKAGIVVVVAAGNSGHDAGSDVQLLSPAYDPTVLAVGAYDKGADAPGASVDDDTSADFTSRGGSRPPDVLAPGMHVMSLHVPGANEDREIYDDCVNSVRAHQTWSSPIFGPNDRFVRGSGTSQAAAMVSGVVALMLSHNPKLTPDDVKAILRDTARKGVKGKDNVKGKGEVQLDGPGGAFANDMSPAHKAQLPAARGTGRLRDARGDEGLPCMSTTHLYDRGHAQECAPILKLRGSALQRALDGDIRGQYYDRMWQHMFETINSAGAYADPGHTPWTVVRRGDGSLVEMWNHHVWTGEGFTTVNGRMVWNDAEWSSLSDPGGDHDWLGRPFASNDWTGFRWSGFRWTGFSLRDDAWRTHSWVGFRWSGFSLRDNVWR